MIRQAMENKQRLINEYTKGKGKNKFSVRAYSQRYNSPRGPVENLKVDSQSRSSTTVWLMDRHGRLMGRANYRGQTSANKKNIAAFGVDETKVIRDEKKYKRIFGRTSSA